MERDGLQNTKMNAEHLLNEIPEAPKSLTADASTKAEILGASNTFYKRACNAWSIQGGWRKRQRRDKWLSIRNSEMLQKCMCFRILKENSMQLIETITTLPNAKIFLVRRCIFLFLLPDLLQIFSLSLHKTVPGIKS